MNRIDPEFLLGLAGVAGTLLGTFIVGAFFYIDSDMHRRSANSEAADMYLRSAIRWVFTAYSIPLLVPLVLSALEPVWGALTFLILGVMLSLLTVDTGRRILTRGGAATSRAFALNEGLTSAAVLVAVVLPWVLGGWIPQPADIVPSLLLLLACGFASTAALVMAQFDATKVDRVSSARPPADESS